MGRKLTPEEVFAGITEVPASASRRSLTGRALTPNEFFELEAKGLTSIVEAPAVDESTEEETVTETETETPAETETDEKAAPTAENKAVKKATNTKKG